MSHLVKSRRFRAATGTTSEQLDQAVTRMQQLTGVMTASREAELIAIDYDIARCDYRTIKTTLEGHVALASGSGLSKLGENWIGYIEKNQHQHLAQPAGWMQHVRNMYLRLYPGTN